jgi:PilZ domain
MDLQIVDRRAEPRFSGATLRITQATMRPGCRVHVVDLSATGAQVECERPLRPGTRVHVRLVRADGTLAIAAVVLRCAVWALHPQAGVTYRGALRFDEQYQGFGGRSASL